MQITKIQAIMPAQYNQRTKDAESVRQIRQQEAQQTSYAKIPLATYQTNLISFGSMSTDYFVKSAFNHTLSLDEIREYVNSGGDINALSDSDHRPAVYGAAYKGAYTIIENLAKQPGFNPNVISTNSSDRDDSFSALGIACHQGHERCVEELLKLDNIDVNIKSDKDGRTPILIAHCTENNNIVKKLLKHPDINVNIVPENNRVRPLIFRVVYNNEVELLAEILKLPNVDLTLEYDGMDVIEFTKKYRSEYRGGKMLEMLENYCQAAKAPITPESVLPENNTHTSAQITEHFIKTSSIDTQKALEFLEQTPLVNFELDDKAAVKAVLETGNPDFAMKVFDYIFHKQSAQKQEYDEKRNKILSKLGSMSYEELLSTPIAYTTEDGYSYLIGKLEYDPNQEVDGQTLFQRACNIDETGKLAKNILERYENVDTSKIKTRSKEIKQLIEEYNETGKYTVLLNNLRLDFVRPGKGKEAFNRAKEFVKSDEFRPEMTASLGNNLVHVLANSSEDGIGEIINLALEKGVDINSQNAKGQTPLMIALQTVSRTTDMEVRKHVFAMISFMLKKGADVYIQDNNGKTPLHYACASTSPTALNLVLSKNPNAHIEDKNGNLAKHYITDDDVKQAYREYMEKAM